MQVPTIKVKPWGEEQGDHVVINEADFDPQRHELLEQEKAKPARKAKAKE